MALTIHGTNRPILKTELLRGYERHTYTCLAGVGEKLRRHARTRAGGALGWQQVKTVFLVRQATRYLLPYQNIPICRLEDLSGLG